MCVSELTTTTAIVINFKHNIDSKAIYTKNKIQKIMSDSSSMKGVFVNT